MGAKHVGLGRGLGALIKDTPPAADADSGGGVATVPVVKIRRNRFQPRQIFPEATLEELVQSIRAHGVLQPLLVRRTTVDANGAEYELIAGERRFRAARKAALTDVPVIVMDVSDADALQLALIENLQREDLNPIEEAEGYAVLADKFHLTQEEIAERLGRARASVANSLRLLGLPEAVKHLLADGSLSEGHAKVLLGLEIAEEQEHLARQCAREGLSVRALEALVGREKKATRKPRAEREDIPKDHLRYLTDRLHRHFGTSVRVTPCRTLANGKKVKGSIELDYYSSEELDRLLEVLGVREEY